MLKRIFVVSLCALVFLCSCSEEQLDRQEIKVYEADEVCKKDLVENIDGEDIVSSSIVYLNYDESNLVKKAIYQSISYIKDIYSNIDGVEVDYYDTSQNLVLEIAYDYESIDLNLFKENLESILDQNSLLAKVKKLPVEVSEFKKIELAGYDCKVN